MTEVPSNPFLHELPEVPSAPVPATAEPIRKTTYRTDKGMTVESSLSKEEVLELLDTLKDDFPQSLARDWRRYRRLTPNKLAWAHKLALDALAREMAGDEKPSSSLPEPTGANYKDFVRNLEDWLSTNCCRKCYVGNRPLRVAFSINSSRSSRPGHISVTDGGRYNNSIYYGRIDPSTGIFYKAQMCNATVEDKLRQLSDSSKWGYVRKRAN